MASSVYSAPLLTDLFADGTTEVVVPTFVHYLEALEARLFPPRKSVQALAPALGF